MAGSMQTAYVAVLIVIYAGVAAATTSNTSKLSERDLHASLMKDYVSTARPVKDVSTKTAVQMQMALLSVQDMNQLTCEVTINVWLRYWWNDEYLTWNSSDYGGLAYTTFPTNPEFNNNIWIPDILMYKSVGEPFSELAYTNAKVENNGNVAWSRAGILKGHYVFRLKNYPFDKQYPIFNLGSWGYTQSVLELKEKTTEPVDVKNYKENVEWTFEGAQQKIVETPYADGVVYAEMFIKLCMKRNKIFHMMQLVIPLETIVLMGLLAFLVPWDSGERASLMATAVLTLTVFLGLLVEHLPFTDDTPWLAQLVLSLWIYSFVIFLFGIITIRVRVAIQTNNEIPRWLWVCADWLKVDLMQPNERRFLFLELEVGKITHKGRIPSDEEVDEKRAQIHAFIKELNDEFSDENNLWGKPRPRQVTEALFMMRRLHGLENTLDANVDLVSPRRPRKQQADPPDGLDFDDMEPASSKKEDADAAVFEMIDPSSQSNSSKGSGNGMSPTSTHAVDDSSGLRLRSMRRLMLGFDGVGGFNEPILLDSAEEDAMVVVGRERDKLMFTHSGTLADKICGALCVIFYIALNVWIFAEAGMIEDDECTI